MKFFAVVITTVIVGILAGIGWIKVLKERKKIKKLEKEVKENEKERQKVTENIIETAQTLISGNDTDSFNASVDFLHQLAETRKNNKD